jgi:hypothetical protein
MQRALCLLWLGVLPLGCSSPPADATPPPGGAGAKETQFEIGVASQLAFDVTKLKQGEWVLYSVKLQGDRQTKHVKYAVTAEEPGAIWIENKVPFDPRPMVIKSKYRRADGRLEERWIGEAGTRGPAKVFPSDRSPSGPPPPERDSSLAQSAKREEVDQAKLGDKTYTCTRITTTLTYPDGRKSVLQDWYSKEVPFSIVESGKSLGGLVRRQFGRLTMELVASDTSGTQPELIIPQEK